MKDSHLMNYRLRRCAVLQEIRLQEIRLLWPGVDGLLTWVPWSRYHDYGRSGSRILQSVPTWQTGIAADSGGSPVQIAVTEFNSHIARCAPATEGASSPGTR